MNREGLSRRRFLTLTGAGLGGAVLGAGGLHGSRFFAAADDPSPQPTSNSAVQPAAPRQRAIIDTHIHVVGSNLPGTPSREAEKEGQPEETLEKQADTIRREMRQAGAEHALGMPRREFGKSDPLGVEGTRRLAKLVPGLHPIGFADPERFDEAHLEGVEEQLKRGDIVALKAYLGYLYYGPDTPGYRPYYKLAAKYKIPVIFHTGDTYSHVAKVRYAHPLPIDDVAVDFPETNFVIAHMGNPWLMDAAELVYKNNKPGFKENVWADLSGLLVGGAKEFEAYRQQGVLKSVIEDVRKAIQFAERPDRFLFGSDWPLAPIPVYRDFIADLVPAAHHQAVFYDNAKALFKLK